MTKQNKEEFVLSEKINYDMHPIGEIQAEDVKEFVKRVKEIDFADYFRQTSMMQLTYLEAEQEIKNKINELAGKSLI